MSISNVFVKMHVGDPGDGGAANAASATTRKALSVNDEALIVGGTRLVQDTDIVYATGEVTATETWTWASYWDALSGGNWLGNEDIPNRSVTLSTAHTIPAGTITVTNQAVADRVLRTALLASRTTDRRHRTWRGTHKAIASAVQRAKFAKQSPQKI